MHKPIVFLLLIVTVQQVFSQQLKAKLYDDITVVKGAKILNSTQNATTMSNNNGYFELLAQPKDTIVIESLFHHIKTIVLQPHHFKTTTVFELRKMVNQLGEVIIYNDKKQPIFKEDIYNKTLKHTLAEDIKNNPHLYKPANATNGLDFVYLIGKLATLFRNKKTKPDVKLLTYKRMDSLFKHSDFFNANLLTQNLQIKKEYQSLFFDFCDAKQVSAELLKENRRMDLLEFFMQNSVAFDSVLNHFQSQNSRKK